MPFAGIGARVLHARPGEVDSGLVNQEKASEFYVKSHSKPLKILSKRVVSSNLLFKKNFIYFFFIICNEFCHTLK